MYYDTFLKCLKLLKDVNVTVAESHMVTSKYTQFHPILDLWFWLKCYLFFCTNKLYITSTLATLQRIKFVTPLSLKLHRCPDQKMDSPEFEFRQPPDERAEFLVLLGRKGWALICRKDRL